MSLLKKLCVAAVLLTPVTQASEPIVSYPNGSLETSERDTRQNHPVITNLMKKVNGVVTSDGAQWLNGYLSRQLYRLSPGHSSEDAYEFMVESFRQMGIKRQFSCKNFSCGSSNFWANDVFDIARLYGLDRQQSYYIGKKENTYYSVYTVRRGNGRSYALVDVFTPETKAVSLASTGARLLTEQGYMDVFFSDAITGANTDMQLMKLQRMLMEDSELSVVLQVQAVVPDSLTDLDRQIDFLRQQGEKVAQTLKAKGVSSNQLRVNVGVVATAYAPVELPADTVWVRVIKLP